MREHLALRKSLAAVIALILVLMMAACGSGSSNPVEPGNSGTAGEPSGGSVSADGGRSISVLYINDPQYWVDQAKEFEGQTGIKVNYVSVPFGQLHDTMVTAFTGGSSDYDVIHVKDDWVAEFASKGFLAPLDGQITDDMKAGIDANAFKPLMYDGQTYGVPRYIWLTQFYYNKEMFDKAGIAAPPATWDEFLQDALLLKEKGVVTYPFADVMTEKNAYANFIVYLRSRGGEFWDYEKGVPSFNSPEGVKALQFLADLNLKYKVMNPQSVVYEQNDTLDNFTQGKAAMIINAPHTFGQANDPKLSKIVGQAAVALIPGDKLKTASYAETGGLAIPANSKNKEAAMEYIRFVTSKEQEKEMALSTGRIPVNKDALNDAEVQTQNPHFAPIAEQLQYPYGIFHHEKATEITDTVSKYVSAAVAGRETPEIALKDAEAEVLGIIGK